MRSPGDIEVLRATGGLSPDIVGLVREPRGFQRADNGAYFVFDRRGHTVWRADRAGGPARKLVEIGGEQGRVLEPSAFDVAPDGTFVLADAPNRRERIQVFSPAGERLGGFALPGRVTPRVSVGGQALDGVGTLAFLGDGLLLNQPETGGLFTVYGLAGTPVRTIGRLRATGHEADRQLHLALNAGMPLVDPAGGYYFVFMTGPPVFRKYDQEGRLVFERLMQGRELDPLVAALPDVWPRRTLDGDEIPLVVPTVLAAAVSPSGELWVSFNSPFTYVFDARGDKIRTVQFRGAGMVMPTSLSFTATGRLLVTPGCYEFDPRPGRPAPGALD
ncbi:MAG: hypothetical protein AB7O67_05600 [Vicinamibacterales bacterium]